MRHLLRDEAPDGQEDGRSLRRLGPAEQFAVDLARVHVHPCRLRAELDQLFAHRARDDDQRGGPPKQLAVAAGIPLQRAPHALGTLRLPDGGLPRGVDPVDCASLGIIARISPAWASPSARDARAGPRPQIPATYAASPSKVFFLPNPVDAGPSNSVGDGAGAFEKDAPRRVLFLGRLDPVKRPWLFAELAARFPEVEFAFVGRPHFEGEGAWRPEGLPRNVRMLRRLDGRSKTEVLSSAAALVNTSIHESLAVSFLETLACETPVISCQDPESVVSRFGSYVGRFDGDGRDALPHFAEALARLLRDREERARLGREARGEKFSPPGAAATYRPGAGRLLEAEEHTLLPRLRVAAPLARPALGGGCAATSKPPSSCRSVARSTASHTFSSRPPATSATSGGRSWRRSCRSASASFRRSSGEEAGSNGRGRFRSSPPVCTSTALRAKSVARRFGAAQLPVEPRLRQVPIA